MMPLQRLALVAVFSVATATDALGHHGLSWGKSKPITLDATVSTVSLAPPHPSMTVTDAKGQVWDIQLGNPRRMKRAGFTETTVAPGDAITIIGNRPLDPAELYIMALRLTVDGQNYDIYPDRIPAE